jgi:hypothetical protein
MTLPQAALAFVAGLLLLAIVLELAGAALWRLWR